VKRKDSRRATPGRYPKAALLSPFSSQLSIFQPLGAEKSAVTIFESLNQSGQHPGDFFEIGLDPIVLLRCKQFASPCKFEQRYTFLSGSPCDAEEVAPIRFGEPAVSFGDVCCDGECCTVELINQESVSACELLGQFADSICVIDRFLIDVQFLETESHAAYPAGSG